MKKNYIFKQIVRFFFVQITITAISIFYFDKFLIGTYTDGYVVIIENLLEDKNRFYF